MIEQPITSDETLEGKFVSMRFEPDGLTVHRAVIPEQEHPDEYAIWKEIRRRRDAARGSRCLAGQVEQGK